MALSSDLISQFVRVTKSEKQKKESTVYGTVTRQGGSTYVKLDGSELLTPVSTTIDAAEGDRVVVLIKNHNAIVTGSISSPAGRSSDVASAVSKAEAASKKIDEYDLIVADKVSTDRFEAEVARIDSLTADNVKVKERLDANEARIKNLDADNVNINEKLTAAEADIDKLKANSITSEIIAAKYATIEALEATNATVNNLEATYGTFHDATVERLDAAEANIDDLEANKLDAATAEITYAKISDLNATNANVTNLEADVADIDTLIFGSASGDTIQSSFANAVIAQVGNAQIKSAMIDNVWAGKITSGDIITNNVHITSHDGKLVISDETLQISDNTRVRVQIGKDSSNDYSINIWDADGNLMFSKGGITDSAIKQAIIRNDMVSDTANISAYKLDINSLFEAINGSNNTIKSTRVYLDDENQSLEVAFKSLSTGTSELGDKVSSYGSEISAVQGQIASKVWLQDINDATDPLNNKITTLTDQYTALEQETDSISATVASHATTLENKADSSTVTTVNNKVTELEANLSGFQSSVSTTYATRTEVSKVQNEVDDLEVGGRNLLLNTKTFVGNNISGSSNLIGETHNQLSIRTYDNSAATSGYVDIISFGGIYVEELGSSYTMSFYARGTDETKLSTFFHGPTNYIQVAKTVQSNGNTTTSLDGNSQWRLTEDWKRYWVTWTLKDTGDISIPKYVLFRLYFGGTAEICGVKLEKGNKASDWTPAPEDIDDNITSAMNAANAAQLTANKNAADMATIVTNFNTDIEDLQTQIDGSITTWFYEFDPTDNGEPAVNWTTVDSKNVHLGDLYYNTLTGYCYRYQVKNNAYSWQRITDTDVTKALSDAKYAQDTADQKRRVFYTQPIPPYDAGDLWVQGSNGDILRCKTAKVSGQTYSSSDWIAASKYTDDTVANSAAQAAANAQQSAADAQEDINNLRIGGRNLLFKSRGNDTTDWLYSDVTVVEDDVKGYCVEKQNATLKENYIATPRTGIVEPSTEYTFSTDIWCNEYLTNFDFFWLSDTTDNPKTGASYTNIRTKPLQTITPNTWTRLSWTFTTHDNDRTGYFRIDCNATKEEGIAAILRVANLKLEKGNRPTDWTPAPEDLEERVTVAESKIIQNDSSIESLVSRTTAVENKFLGYSTTEAMNSAISQSAQSITSSVSETYTTKTEFKNLEIGGRNLIAGTDETREYVGNGSESSNGYKDVWTGKTISIPTGTEYVVSFDAKADVAQTIRCFFYSPNTTTSSLSSTGQTGSGADGMATVTLTTEWARYWVKWTQTPATAQKSVIIGRNVTENDVYIRAVKFESGHTPTHWTLAPEDMATSNDLATVQSSSDLIETRVSTAESLIEQLSDSLAVLIRDGNGESLMVQTEEGWTFSTSQIQSMVDTTSENLDKLTNEVGDVSATVGALRQAVDDLGVLNDYVKIGVYEEEPCIELGESDSDFKLLITNTRIMFMEGSDVPAYLNNQSLFIKKAVIEEELQQGEFVWKIRSNGNLGLIWKGATS